MSASAPTVTLDVRKLPPPEPLERILDALADLPADCTLRVVHRREPFPLYDLLRGMGYTWRTRGEDEHFEILIWPLDATPSRGSGGAPAPC
ncbi:DUF2249 domain-containing protein [Thiohalocapsa marina]|uniref:DUF2249 domain-containing protein n=1 Tax=Thiohalocapsa marina TaxID=424902 RepID=A0A5M8FVG7_9GAMM|nr:DUF2249 domain-containing protein [Thiohalocapsa marina]KAA6187814.1 DUF2249 domain-containing protein [Thiohalocapsa marina]